jgi:hypothetical protein
VPSSIVVVDLFSEHRKGEMAQRDQPRTVAECVGLLVAVLGWLDTLAMDAEDPASRSLTFAAIRVQEAIDLIKPVDEQSL